MSFQFGNNYIGSEHKSKNTESTYKMQYANGGDVATRQKGYIVYPNLHLLSLLLGYPKEQSNLSPQVGVV